MFSSFFGRDVRYINLFEEQTLFILLSNFKIRRLKDKILPSIWVYFSPIFLGIWDRCLYHCLSFTMSSWPINPSNQNLLLLTLSVAGHLRYVQKKLFMWVLKSQGFPWWNGEKTGNQDTWFPVLIFQLIISLTLEKSLNFPDLFSVCVFKLFIVE